MIYIFIIIVMTIVGSAASLFLKKSSTCENIGEYIQNANIYIGGGLYCISALLNIVVLRYMEYSIVLPMTSLTYVWTLILSKIVLKEGITNKKVTGTLLILIGAFVITR
ncbi:putative uncharacterized protein [Roseburia sp. CAG:182]|nr:putative uncharacterized protein [Roseburia sp. CAG:182]